MRHLGFMVDLMKKSLHISGKQIAKVLQYFDHFLAVIRKKGRIRVKQVRRMLGLQVWIGTVFRVARQYLTSACDLLRATQEGEFYYPRRHKQLTARLVYDLKFWRRFVRKAPAANFDYLLSRLPVNASTLGSDAATSFGMAGILRFRKEHPRFRGFDVLF